MGRITCFILTCFRKFFDLFRTQETTAQPIQKILFIKLIEQGATVLAYSAICRAAHMVGRENVYFCVFQENREIIDILGILPEENVFAIRHKHFFIFLSDIVGALHKIRRVPVDAVVDMEFFARASAILSYLTGAKRRVGLHRYNSEAPYRGDLMTHRIQYNPYLHTSKTYNLLVEALNTEPDDIPLLKIPIDHVEEFAPKFTPQNDEIQEMKKLLVQSFSRDIKKPIILLNPNASDMLPLRKWSVENFITLGKDILRANDSASIVITGAPSEEKAAHEICAQIGSPRAVSLAGKTSLRSLIVLYTMADILVTNDSGPAHFASMTDIDTVVLYGPETPKLYGSLGNHFHAIEARIACSPCVNVFNHRFSPCTNNVCMQNISVEEVSEKVLCCIQKKIIR
ncbi:MAG: glycosyltransferase family 9 protein [Syntrophaceae bacterium]